MSVHLLAVNKAHHCFSGSLKYFRVLVVVVVVVTCIADVVVADRDESVHQCALMCFLMAIFFI
jgi:hypothetical protein